MEFPELGQHCGWLECKQLDFLPFKCELCEQVFCKNHRSCDEHQCPIAYQRDVRVPTCPLCNAIVQVQRGEDPNIKVNEHISNQCRQTDIPAPQSSRKSKQCNMHGCKQIDTVQVRCEQCGRQFCLRHRLEQDHKCEGRRSQLANAVSTRTGSVPKTSGSSTARSAQPRLTQKTGDNRRPQQSLLNATGRELAQARQERQASAPATARTAASTAPPRVGPSQSAAAALPSSSQQLAQDEALALALQESEQSAAQPGRPPVTTASGGSAGGGRAASDEDAELQRAIAASLRDQEPKKEESSCVII